MEKYKKEFQDYCKKISKSKKRISKFLRKIGVYDDENNIVSDYGGENQP